MSKVKIEGNASGTGTLTIAAPNTNTDRTLTLPDGAGEILTDGGDVLPSGTLAFRARVSSAQVCNAGVSTLLQCDTEIFDTGNCYNTSTYRFTPTVAGYYFITGTVMGTLSSPGTVAYINAQLNKNTTLYHFSGNQPTNGNWDMATASCIMYMNGSTDYATFEVGHNNAGTLTLISNGADYNTNFSGYLVEKA